MSADKVHKYTHVLDILHPIHEAISQGTYFFIKKLVTLKGERAYNPACEMDSLNGCT